jgi:hypothetical protein
MMSAATTPRNMAIEPKFVFFDVCFDRKQSVVE